MDPLKEAIRSIPGFPKPGIVFRDITPVLANPALLRQAIERLAEPFRDAKVDLVVGAEARGFILAPAIALELDAGFVPVRKKGKLPYQTAQVTYELEYGTDTLEMHRDAVTPDSRVLMVDDLLATGGTMRACCDMRVPHRVELPGRSRRPRAASRRQPRLLRERGGVSPPPTERHVPAPGAQQDRAAVS